LTSGCNFDQSALATFDDASIRVFRYLESYLCKQSDCIRVIDISLAVVATAREQFQIPPAFELLNNNKTAS
jgi:hypothetical protein